jgi:predicted esterase YcpF (UPF0227 family)
VAGTIIYLHGFASTGTSEKSQSLRSQLPDTVIFAPDLPADPLQVVTIVADIVASVTQWPLVFVGTSLGGFWANYFAQYYDAPAILVNPSTRPDESMACRVGQPLVNYVTGEPILITPEHISLFVKYRAAADQLYNGNLIHLFAAEDDSVINYNIAVQDLKYFKSVSITPDGGHRYTQHWDRVVHLVATML